MQINRKLNLALQIDREDGQLLYAHSMPISREVFERYYLVISKAYAKMWSEGLSVISGPRIAALLLRDVADNLGVWEDVEKGLMNEIRRLTNIISHGPQGWAPMPLYDAVRTEMLTEDEMSEVEGAAVFFTLVSSMMKAKDLAIIQQGLKECWGGQSTSCNCTEFAASLTI